MKEMEIMRKLKAGLVSGWKLAKPFLFLMTIRQGKRTRTLDGLMGLWTKDGGPEGPAHSRPTIVVGRPWLGPNGSQLGLGDRWGHK